MWVVNLWLFQCVVFFVNVGFLTKDMYDILRIGRYLEGVRVITCFVF